MKSHFEFCCCVYLHPFRCSVIVLCGNLDGNGLRRKFVNETRRVKAPKSAPSFYDIGSEIRGETRTYRGVTCVNRDKADCCYVCLPEWKSTVFVHEAYRAVRGIMGFRDMEEGPSAELDSYLIEHLFDEIVNADLCDRRIKRGNR